MNKIMLYWIWPLLCGFPDFHSPLASVSCVPVISISV